VADYVAYFGGQWLPFSEVKIDPMDRGFLVGDCVFDVARTFNGKSFRMKAHVERLYRSLKFVRIGPGSLAGGDGAHQRGGDLAQRAPARRCRRLSDLAVRHARGGGAGPTKRGRPSSGCARARSASRASPTSIRRAPTA